MPAMSAAQFAPSVVSPTICTQLFEAKAKKRVARLKVPIKPMMFTAPRADLQSFKAIYSDSEPHTIDMNGSLLASKA